MIEVKGGDRVQASGKFEDVQSKPMNKRERRINVTGVVICNKIRSTSAESVAKVSITANMPDER